MNTVTALAGVVIKELYRRKDFYVLFVLTALLTLSDGFLTARTLAKPAYTLAPDGLTAQPPRVPTRLIRLAGPQRIATMR